MATTLNGNYYANIKKRLRKVIKTRRQGQLRKGDVFPQDIAAAHRSLVSMAACAYFELINHPLYSPDLSIICSTTWKTLSWETTITVMLVPYLLLMTYFPNWMNSLLRTVRWLFTLKETMQLSITFESNACNISQFWHYPFIEILWTFPPTLVRISGRSGDILKITIK